MVKDKPPLLSDNPYPEYDWRKKRLYGTDQDLKTINTHHCAFEAGKQAQRKSDIKWYEERLEDIGKDRRAGAPDATDR